MVQTLNNTYPARDTMYQMVHYLRKNVTYADNGTVFTIGTLPAGAQILKGISGVQVNVAFNAGSTNVLDVGTSATGDLFATDLALGTIGYVTLDEVVTETVAVDTTVTCTVQLTGTAASAGSAVIIIAFAPNR